jgi:hypothetical protein
MISLRSLVVTILVAFVAPLLACGFLSLIGQFTSWLQIKARIPPALNTINSDLRDTSL